MSGGTFYYRQYHITMIRERIEEELEDELHAAKTGKTKGHRKNPERIIKAYTEAVSALKIAEVYLDRIDWYIAGDDSEESFLQRLEEELRVLKKS